MLEPWSAHMEWLSSSVFGLWLSTSSAPWNVSLNSVLDVVVFWLPSQMDILWHNLLHHYYFQAYLWYLVNAPVYLLNALLSIEPLFGRFVIWHGGILLTIRWMRRGTREKGTLKENKGNYDYVLVRAHVHLSVERNLTCSVRNMIASDHVMGGAIVQEICACWYTQLVHVLKIRGSQLYLYFSLWCTHIQPTST